MMDTSLSLASGLTNAAGLRPRDTICIFAPNSTLYPHLLFAGQAAGLTVSTANSSYTAGELEHQLTTSSASVLLVGSDLVSVAKEAAKAAGVKESNIYVLPGVDGKVVTGGLKSWEALKGKPGFEPVKMSQKDLETAVACELSTAVAPRPPLMLAVHLDLPFSSGTTGKGKGVALSAANVTAVSQQLNNVKGLFDGPEVVMGILPL